MILRMASSLPLVLSAILTFESKAWADVAPPDACYAVNEPCSWEDTSGEKSGICRTRTCTRGTPDGSVQYECLRCVYDPTATTTSADASPQSTDDPVPTKDASDDDAGRDGGGSSGSDCDCVVLGHRREGWVVSVMLLVGFTALQTARRSSRERHLTRRR